MSIDFIGRINKVKTIKSKYHDVVQCNFWMKRNKKCPYCLNGSEPVEKEVILEMLNNNGVKKR